MSWVITHKDAADIEESWSFPVRKRQILHPLTRFNATDSLSNVHDHKGHMPDVLRVVEGWDPRCAAILSKAPSCVDWKLVYRDPLPTWISKRARLALIGDAAVSHRIIFLSGGCRFAVSAPSILSSEYVRLD